MSTQVDASGTTRFEPFQIDSIKLSWRHYFNAKSIIFYCVFENTATKFVRCFRPLSADTIIFNSIFEYLSISDVVELNWIEFCFRYEREDDPIFCVLKTKWESSFTIVSLLLCLLLLLLLLLLIELMVLEILRKNLNWFISNWIWRNLNEFADDDRSRWLSNCTFAGIGSIMSKQFAWIDRNDRPLKSNYLRYVHQ